MQTNTQPLGAVDGPSPLVRPRFETGMLLQADDLEQLIRYMHVLHFHMHGWGVLRGLEVKQEAKGAEVLVTVTSGLALDSDGNPVHVPEAQTLAVDRKAAAATTALWIVLYGRAEPEAARQSMDAFDGDDAHDVDTRVRYHYAIEVMAQAPEKSRHGIVLARLERKGTQANASWELDRTIIRNFPANGAPDGRGAGSAATGSTGQAAQPATGGASANAPGGS